MSKPNQPNQSNQPEQSSHTDTSDHDSAHDSDHDSAHDSERNTRRDSSPSLPAPRQRVGARGEGLAADYLRREGWTILERNFETKQGELDIVARTTEQLGDQDIPVVAFVEVKTRRGGPVLPELTINRKKRRKLTLLGKLYRDLRDLHDASCRFDVIAVDLADNPPDVQHYPAAFDILARFN